jgi:uncharacterized protein YjlB
MSETSHIDDDAAHLTIEDYLFADDGHVPNNPWLPLLVYRDALETGDATGALYGAVRAQWLDRRLEERSICAS